MSAKLTRVGSLLAVCLGLSGQLGMVASKSFAGLAPAGWKVVGVDSQETAVADNLAAKAIDGDLSTFWHTCWNQDLPSMSGKSTYSPCASLVSF